VVRPKVSIVTITYNQKLYIRQALDSFLAQQANFEIECVIADDCSTDGTQDIIREYANKHPDFFKLLLRSENIGAAKNSISALRTATGDYIALCEGDDYWTDPKKLQLQADFLDAHPDYALCFHPVNVFYEDEQKEGYVFPEYGKEEQSFTVKELLKRNFIQTNSVMYRRRSYEDIPNNIMPLDWYLHLYHAKFGKLGFIGTVMSAYRRHAGGLWWNSDRNLDEIWKKHGLAHFALYVEMLKLYEEDPVYKDIIYESLYRMFDVLISIDKKYDVGLLDQVIQKFPDTLEPFIIKQHQSLIDKESLFREEMGQLTFRLQQLEKDNHILRSNIDDLVTKIEHIKRNPIGFAIRKVKEGIMHRQRTPKP
jgi:glycosyltransferase involved in cell wall biosynthesis